MLKAKKQAVYDFLETHLIRTITFNSNLLTIKITFVNTYKETFKSFEQLTFNFMIIG